MKNPTISPSDVINYQDENGEPHRLDGSEYWFKHSELHRLDGPAYTGYGGEMEYWVDGEIPTTILDLIITDREMIFNAELVPEVSYDFEASVFRAYRFFDPDELALAILYYS